LLKLFKDLGKCHFLITNFKHFKLKYEPIKFSSDFAVIAGVFYTSFWVH